MRLPRPLVDALRIKSVDDTVAYLVTAALDGRPNVAVQPFTDVLNDEYVLLPDLFAQKTKVNLNENLRGALTIASPSSFAGWSIEGPCNVFQWGHPDTYSFQGLLAGDVLSRWGDWTLLENPEDLPEEVRPTVLAQRGVIVLRAERVIAPEEAP